jgi:hypothetical protein
MGGLWGEWDELRAGSLAFHGLGRIGVHPSLRRIGPVASAAAAFALKAAAYRADFGIEVTERRRAFPAMRVFHPIREFLIPKIGRQKKGKPAVQWVMRNLQWKKIQDGLAAEWLDVGIASGLVADGNVQVVKLESYGFKLLLPEGEKPDRTGWKRLADMPVAMLDGDAGFRRFLAECGREHGVDLTIGAECTSFPQAVDLAEEAGWAVFVPEYWWRRRKDWAARTQNLPGLDQHQRTFQLGWNQKVAERRPELAQLVKVLGGMK